MRLLPLTFLAPVLITALNDIFIPLPYPECNSCLDKAANSCPGNYRDRSYAECICAGTGSKLVAGCVSTCQAVDSQPMGAGEKVVRGYYSYCIIFFPEMCAEAVGFVNEEFYGQYCGAGASGSGGSGGSGGSAGGSGGGGSGSGDGTVVGGPTGGLGDVLGPTGTARTTPAIGGATEAATGTGTAGGVVSRPPSAGVVVNALPTALGVILGMGALVLNL